MYWLCVLDTWMWWRKKKSIDKDLDCYFVQFKISLQSLQIFLTVILPRSGLRSQELESSVAVSPLNGATRNVSSLILNEGKCVGEFWIP